MANVTFTRSTDATAAPATTQGLITFNTGKKAIYLSDGSTYHTCGVGTAEALLNRGWISIPSSYQTYNTFITSTNTACVAARNVATDWLVQVSSIPYSTLYPSSGVAGSSTNTVSISSFIMTRASSTSGYEFIGRPCCPHDEASGYSALTYNMVLGSSTKGMYTQYVGYRVTSGTFYGIRMQNSNDIGSYIKVIAYRY